MPLYIQLKDVIVENIETGKWVYGDTIPTETELQKQYKISRITVRQAIGELVNSGILTRIQGKGTFVAAPKLESIRPELTSFTRDMNERGFKTKSYVMDFSIENSNERLQRVFQIADTVKVTKIERIRLVSDIPIGIHTTYLNTSITPHLQLDKYILSDESLYSALHNEGVLLGEAHETVEAVLADQQTSGYLDISVGSAVLALTRITRLQDGNVFEYSKMLYRADKYKYTNVLK
ncbi:GntR family transcriptional regulator [Paenibacillus agricola]|uniref:GntR family transcriptional regulator n=1 Tax=Paenibacillus agricola TaxID=2716264 RepID=A0ABX0JC91_9BACL|nr:GntR family transcriptional regulator [Paenibacillus agricola]NHN32851.1 GntR family transcriptional regulator [Paenibacillus agricola]